MDDGGKANVIGAKRPSVDGHGSVETLAQTWTPLDREVLTAIRKTSALLGKTCDQNGLLGDLREGLEMSGTSAKDR